MSNIFVGIDMAKRPLARAVRPTGQVRSRAPAPAEFPALVAPLRHLAPTRIVLEATGGLATLLATTRAAAGLPVAVVNPRVTRDFAKAGGRLAKTDRVEAHALAHLGEALAPACDQAPSAPAQAFEGQSLLRVNGQWYQTPLTALPRHLLPLLNFSEDIYPCRLAPISEAHLKMRET